MSERPEHLEQLRPVDESNEAEFSSPPASLSDGLYQATYTTIEIMERYATVAPDVTPSKIYDHGAKDPGRYVLEHAFSQLHVTETSDHRAHMERLLDDAGEKIKAKKEAGDYMDYLDQVFTKLELHADTNVSRLLELLFAQNEKLDPYRQARVLYGTVLLLEAQPPLKSVS